jgi:DNA topoisomerase VI subunit B
MQGPENMEKQIKTRRGPLQRLFDKRLDRLAEKRIDQFIAAYATDANGNVDALLAESIRREVTRRSTMGREMDVFEPIRWTFASFVLSTAGALGLKALMGDKLNVDVAKTVAASTALSSGIGLLRLQSRFEAGLQGGLETAFAMVEMQRAQQQVSAVRQ